MKNVSYAQFLQDRSVSILEEMEFDSFRTTHPVPDAAEVCVPVYKGFFKERVEAGGKERTFYVFIPTRHPASGPQVMLLAKDGQTAAELLAHTPWVDAAEEKGFALMALEPLEGTWNTAAALEEELPYLEAAYQFAVDRNLYSVNETGYYAAGYGAGGYVGQLYAAKHCSVLSGYVSIGGGGVEKELLASIGSESSVGDVLVKKREVPLPVWLIEEEDARPSALSYWRAVNRAELRWTDGGTEVYAPDIARAGSLINEQPVQQVRWSVHPWTSLEEDRDFVEEIWRFLRRVKRHAGITLNGTLRPAKTWKELGMRRYTAVIAGQAREWYVYVPSVHFRQPEKKLPLVLAIHGYSCSGELFMGDSEWYKVAEERGFFVLFASASVGGRLGGLHPANVPLPAWNSTVPQPEEGSDDLAYFRHVLQAVRAEYPIDPGRQYVSGHSNGSMMTQCLLFEMTGEFAAFAPEGACYNEFKPETTALPPFSKKVAAPVWLMKGTFDIGCQADFSPGSANRLMTEHFCRENGIDPDQTPVWTENGRFINRTYLDGSGDPRVIFTELAGYPHAYTPEVSWMVWDGFFSHFRRNEDGTITYLK